MRKFLSIFFVSLLLSQFVRAQEVREHIVSGDFTNSTFKKFVKEVEAQSNYFFYYDATVLDSLPVQIAVSGKPLRAMLNEILDGTGYYFAVDDKLKVYIALDQPIVTHLPNSNSTKGDSSESISYKGPDYAQKELLLASAESKVYDIGPRRFKITPGKSTVSGYIRNATTGEPVIGAAVYIDFPSIGTTSDVMGFYSITIPRGKQTLKIKSFGMRETKRQVIVYSDGKLDIDLIETVVALKEHAVKSGADINVSGNQMGQMKLSIKNLKQVPTVFGETDLLRTIMTLPGVKSVGESSVGLNVRGGSADQNLILYNDAVIYNPSHLFGFFSAFNPDVIKEVELYKSTIPTRFGGRLASVLDISSRDGNKKKYIVSGGIGAVTGRLTVEGPLLKDKSSFIVGGRTTYSDWILRQLDNTMYNKAQASFYDVNMQLSHEVNSKNSIFVSGYLSNDKFKLWGDTLYGYQNKLASIKWTHTFSPKLSSIVAVSHSEYDYSLSSYKNDYNAFDMAFGIRQSNAKVNFNYLAGEKHTFDFGLGTTRYKLQPGSFTPRNEQSVIIPEIMEPEQALESFVHVEDQIEVSPRLLLTGGLRYTFFHNLGPKSVTTYVEGYPYDPIYDNGKVYFEKGDVTKQYQGPEVRASLRYSFDRLTVKASYNTMRQYIHLLSNTMTISPTDTWKLSDYHIKPQLGEQFSLGFYKNLRGNKLELSAEVYYKKIQNFLDFKGGDSLILNSRIETAVISTFGKAYGVELMVKKLTGKVNGWISYTYARSLLKAQDPEALDAPNNGDYYPSNYDKPHDFTAITNYRFSHRFSFSANFTYSTGRPYTPPIGKYLLNGTPRMYYAERNQYRIPDYYRMDISLNIEGNHKVKKLAHSSWTIAVYNLLGRKNASSVFFQSVNGQIQGYKLSIFGRPIPTLTYNFRF
jgi:hypothetical protein